MDDQDRRAGELLCEEFATAETRLYGHISETFRWMMATLFAANGGALVTLADGNPRAPLSALICFALGLVFSLLMGAISAFVSLRFFERMSKMRLKMHEGLISGEIPTQELLDFSQQIKVNWKTWAPSYAGLAALILLTAGLVIVGVGSLQPNPPGL